MKQGERVNQWEDEIVIKSQCPIVSFKGKTAVEGSVVGLQQVYGPKDLLVHKRHETPKRKKGNL